MGESDSSLAAARERIRRVYDPQLLQTAAGRLAERLGEHFRSVLASAGRVLNWEDPAANVERAAAWLQGAQAPAATPAERPPDSPAGNPPSDALLQRFDSLIQTILSRGMNLHDPRYLGHQVPASVPLAALFDAVGSATNQVMAIYEMGPWASAVEEAMVETLGRQIGWEPGAFAGLITHGGSLANLTALLTARNVSLGDVWERGLPGRDPQPVMVVHSDAHYGIARSAGILGLGTDQVVRAALDERRRMDPDRLDDTLRRLAREGRPVVAVVACACATPIGAFDPLPDVADVCRRHGVWLHVDAAHGGAACLSSRYRHLVSGLDLADSIVWDAHKMLFMPALCAFVFYRDRAHRFEAFRQEAPYLFDPTDPGLADFDSGLKTLECTKRAAAFGLWGLWSLFGPGLFADLVDVTFSMGRRFYEKLAAANDFEPLHEPQCNIVAFRHRPAALHTAGDDVVGRFQLALRREVIRSGSYYIVPTVFEGHGALRVTIINPLTEEHHLDGLMQSLRETADRMLRSQHAWSS